MCPREAYDFVFPLKPIRWQRLAIHQADVVVVASLLVDACQATQLDEVAFGDAADGAADRIAVLHVNEYGFVAVAIEGSVSGALHERVTQGQVTGNLTD